MALPISIEDLLNKQRVESNRIEFEEGWNPTSIYRSICAFANDIDNLGGGYILIGVEEKNGAAVRPVKGVETTQLDAIQQKIVQLNNQIMPIYYPRVSVEFVDGKSIIVLWIPTGNERPYAVPDDVTSTNRTRRKYIRYGTSTIEAKGDLLDELDSLKDRTPFDERGNQQIKQTDLSLALIHDHLAFVGSRLVEDIFSQPMATTLEQMNLMTGPKEFRMLKNVAAMMFSDHPEKFFPMSRVEIVLFPQGRVENPDNLIEIPVITGPVPLMIRKTLDFLKTNILRETISKPADRAESIRIWNYPYQALEEAVVNALYHRDYKVTEPVEISIEPDRISILSYSGPDRSITMDAIQKAQILRSRRYRNRNLGDFLKELSLTEGRATGIPTIQKELKRNGSAEAKIETDEDRSYFLIDLPCHKDAIGLWENETEKNVSEDSIKQVLQKKNIKLNEKTLKVLVALAINPTYTQAQIALEMDLGVSDVMYCVSVLKHKKLLRRIGTRKYGSWALGEILIKELIKD